MTPLTPLDGGVMKATRTFCSTALPSKICTHWTHLGPLCGLLEMEVLFLLLPVSILLLLSQPRLLRLQPLHLFPLCLGVFPPLAHLPQVN